MDTLAEEGLTVMEVSVGHGPLAQPQRLATPEPPQLAGRVQEPQLRMLPQPSLTGPQSRPSSGQVWGVQVPGPHRLGPPPPQV
jgi:hypothetical protein